MDTGGVVQAESAPVEGRPLEETELVERAKRGDAEAYALLVQQHQELVVRAVYLIIRDAVEAEDVAQEAFVRAYLSLQRLRVGAPFRPWLLKVATNEARNRRKSAERRSARAERAARVRPSGDAAPSPEAAALAAEQRGALERALDALREPERLAILYRYVLDLSEADTAGILECAPGTIKSRLSRGLRQLRRHLAADPALDRGSDHG